MIHAILACDSQGGIARNGTMPWPSNKKDLRHFKEVTSGATVVMGRKTWEAADMPTPLPGRHNVVVTSQADYKAEGAEIITGDIKPYLTTLTGSSTVFIIGGAVLFEQLIDDIQILHLTRIAGRFDCDTFLPMRKIVDRFAIIDTFDVDDKTRFETHFARRLHDLSFDTDVRC